MRKFLKRGWTINVGEILKIMFQISQLDLTNIQVLEEQLIGVDVVYFTSIIENLQKIGKKNVDYDDISGLIDKVFYSISSSYISEDE